MKNNVIILKGDCNYLEEDLLPEYDLSKMKARKNPYAKSKGMLVELEPEVSKHFHSPKDVNKFLKDLIETVKPLSI